MLTMEKPFYPSEEDLANMCAEFGLQSWCLQETFRPVSVSKSLDEPLSNLTPELTVSGRQWLIQAPARAPINAQSGLLHLGKNLLYESNPLNKDPEVRRWRRKGSMPPGWWHRSRYPNRSKKPLLLLSTHNNDNYFHWMTQPGLAPLFLQDHFGLKPISGSALGLSHRPRRSPPSYVSSLLGVFAPGVPLVQGISLASESICRFALQEHTSDVVVSPAQLKWLNRRCCDQLQLSQKPWRRVLISRKLSNRRRCLNEDELFAALSLYGFERYCLERLNVVQQLRLFSESLLLVGAHGAGFSNLVACASQASIIELLPRPGSFSHYYVMADILGLSHGHLLASRFDSETDNFYINPSSLLQLLREMNLL